MLTLSAYETQLSNFWFLGIRRFRRDNPALEITSAALYCCPWSGWVSLCLDTRENPPHNCPDYEFVEFADYSFKTFPEWQLEYEKHGQIQTGYGDAPHAIQGDEDMNRIFFEYLVAWIKAKYAIYERDFYPSWLGVQMLDSAYGEFWKCKKPSTVRKACMIPLLMTLGLLPPASALAGTKTVSVDKVGQAEIPAQFSEKGKSYYADNCRGREVPGKLYYGAFFYANQKNTMGGYEIAAATIGISPLVSNFPNRSAEEYIKEVKSCLLTAHEGDIGWLQRERTGEIEEWSGAYAITRVGWFGTSQEPASLYLYTDHSRGFRVGVWALQSFYSLEEARETARRIARSITGKTHD